MNLRMIPTSVREVLDYLTGSALLAAPELFRLKDVPSSALAFRLAGGVATAYSLLTDYELGAKKIVPMPVHLMLDAASGTLLAASPWIFGSAKNGTRYWLPHVLGGLFEILAAGTTKTQPSYYEVKPGQVGKVRRLLGV
jgi:SPW repeat